MADKVAKRTVKVYIDGKEVEASVGMINKQVRKLQNEMKNLTIGTDRGCDLVFDDPQMLPMHAVINADAEKLTIEECSETGITYIGGMKIFASNALRSGDVVTIGSTSFQIFFE